MEDILLLVQHFVQRYNAELGKCCTGVSPDAMRLLMGHDWRGNVREMQNVIERAVIFAEDETIKAADIGLIGSVRVPSIEENESLQATLRAWEKEHITRVLARHDWDKAEAARALGIGLSSLYRKLDELEIAVSRKRRRTAG